MRKSLREDVLRIGVSSMKRCPIHLVDLTRIRRELSLPRLAAREGEAYLDEFEESPDGRFVYVPRHYDVPQVALPEPLREVWVGPEPLDEYPAVPCRVSPRNESQEKAIERLSGQDGFLVAACGWGKTPVALSAYAQEACGPLLVTVQTRVALTHWTEQIAACLEVPGGVGQVGDGVCDWRGRGAVVATMQSLVTSDLPADFWPTFRRVILDEIHQDVGPEYSAVLRKLPGLRWGLTSTLPEDPAKRRLLALHVGSILHEDLRTVASPSVLFAETGVVVDDSGRGEHQGKFLSALLLDPRFLDVAHGTIELLRRHHPGRKILVTGERVEALERLAARRPEGEAGVVTGKVRSEAERAEALARPVCFATLPIVQTTLNDLRLDTLLLLTPVPDYTGTRQILGRLRDRGAVAKPLAVVLEATRNPTGAQASAEMREAVKRLGYPCLSREIDPAELAQVGVGEEPAP